MAAIRALSITAIETPFLASHLGSGLRMARVAIFIALVPSAVYSTYRGSRWFVIHLCQKAVDYVLEKTGDQTLEERDRDDLRGFRFKTLSWMNH
jgi:type IV pilus biogenesis protein CpaD/CtpE